MSLLANLKIKLGLDSKEFERGVDKSKSKANSFANGLKKIGGMMAAAFSIAAVTGFVKAIISAAKEQIKVENELGAAIRANGKNVDITLKSYKAFASELQRNSTIGDEVTLGLIRLAETMQSNAPKEAAKNAIALSKALGIDLNTAIKMSVLAQEKQFSMLERYSPSLREANTVSEKTIEYNKLIASGLQLVSDELNTTAGRAQQASNNWGDFQEKLGAFILNSKIVSNGIKVINDDITIANSNLKWYEKWWYRITIQHEKGAEAALKLAEAEEEAATSAANAIGGGGIEKQVVTVADRVKELKQQISDNNSLIKEGGDYELVLKAIDDTKTLQTELDKLRGKLKETKIEVGGNILGAGPKMETRGKENVSVSTSDELPQGLELGRLNDKIEENTDRAAELYDEYFAKWDSFKQAMADSAMSFGTDVVGELGNAFGELAATGEFPEDFGMNVLSIIGSFITQLGTMLIGLGIASEAFQSLLASAFTNPISAGLAIAAGAGLVLLGSAISGFAKAGPTGSSSSVSASGGSSSSYTPTSSRAQDQEQRWVFELEGTKLIAAINNTNRRRTIIR